MFYYPDIFCGGVGEVAGVTHMREGGCKNFAQMKIFCQSIISNMAWQNRLDSKIRIKYLIFFNTRKEIILGNQSENFKGRLIFCLLICFMLIILI